MEAFLKWRVGKFAYPRGGNSPLHIMDLHDYQLDDALDIAAILAARTSRLTGNSELMADSSLLDWYRRSAALMVADIAKAFFGERSRPTSILDVYAGLGLQFECIKETMATALVDCNYVAMGRAEQRHVFERLHGKDQLVGVRYHDRLYGPPVLDEGQPFDLTIINHHGAFRQPDAPVPSLDTVLASLCSPAILALRVGLSDKDSVRTTIKGVQVQLPSLFRLLSSRQLSSPFWYSRVFPNFDEGLFLPDAAMPPTGLLIAYDAGRDHPLPFFKPIGESISFEMAR